MQNNKRIKQSATTTSRQPPQSRSRLWQLSVGLLVLVTAAAVVVVVLAGGLAFVGGEQMPSYAVYDQLGSHAAIAHRGGAGLWPENTLYSFSRALELGVDALELDVHLSADGEIVVIHDDTVDRTTDGSGAVQSMSLSELRKLDAGYRLKSSEGATFQGLGIRIPTLKEVLALEPTVALVIEIKHGGLHTQLCQAIQDAKAEDRVIVGGMDSQWLDAFRDLCPTVATSAGESEVRKLYALHLVRAERLFRGRPSALQVPEEAEGRQIVTERFMTAARTKNMAVHVWTVNEVPDMQRLLALDVDGIISDYPDRLLEVLGRR